MVDLYAVHPLLTRSLTPPPTHPPTHPQLHQTGTPLGLPPFSRPALVDHTTDCIFQVTGGHEYLGGLVQYLMDPSILPAKIAAHSDRTEADCYVF